MSEKDTIDDIIHNILVENNNYEDEEKSPQPAFPLDKLVVDQAPITRHHSFEKPCEFCNDWMCTAVKPSKGCDRGFVMEGNCVKLPS